MSMLTMVLLLSLLVSFLSIVMTVGNALNTTSLAKFWALIATASVFVTTFIFIVDSFDLMDDRGKSGFATEVNASSIDTPAHESDFGQDQPIHNDTSNSNSIDNANNIVTKLPIQNASEGQATDSRVARIMLLDLFANHFSGNVEGISVTQRDWLMQNTQLYPADTDEKRNRIKAMAIEARNLDQIYRNIDKHKEGIIRGTGIVLDKTVDETSGIQEMQVNLVGPDGGVYVLYYPAITQLNIGDWVQFYGTPITGKNLRSEFFGSVNSLLVYANYIGK